MGESYKVSDVYLCPVRQLETYHEDGGGALLTPIKKFVIGKPDLFRKYFYCVTEENSKYPILKLSGNAVDAFRMKKLIGEFVVEEMIPLRRMVEQLGYDFIADSLSLRQLLCIQSQVDDLFSKKTK